MSDIATNEDQEARNRLDEIEKEIKWIKIRLDILEGKRKGKVRPF